ncbi:cytidine deaminase [bacterium]|nr:cytidine deaminase [bacterium]
MSRESGSETTLSELSLKDLASAAKAAVMNSYSPYSKFPVGAAALASSKKTYSGTNVENASYGLSVCAERVAILKAVAEGERKILALAVFAPTEKPVSPCGACLAVLGEFADGGARILMLNEKEEIRSTLDKLLPERFNLKRFNLNPKER